MAAVDTSRPAGQEVVGDSKPKPVATSNTVGGFGEKDDPAHALPTTPLIATPSTSSVFGDSFVAYWWQAIAACAIMLYSLMAIILILSLHQNRPLPDWPLTITLNSLVSIMVVILKASMLALIAAGLSQTKWLWFEKPRPISHYATYDKANYGPVNALKLLWILRGKVTRSQILGFVGLLVIIIAVAIDPFTQQVIQYSETTSPSAVGSNATLPRTSVYNIAGLHTGAGLSTLDNPMIGAIQAGFWTPGTASYAVSANKCTTGNCSFTEPYRSVGICNACSDLTASISQKCDRFISLCNYTLPTGSSLSLDQQWMAGYNNWGTNVPGYFGAREFIWSNGTLPGENFTCRGTACPVSAAGCYLYPCINTYTANILNGILEESITSSIPLTSNGVGCYTNLRKDCLTPTDWAALSTQGVSHNTDPGSDYIFYCNYSTYLYDSSDYPDPTGPRFTDACVYDFDVESYYSMQGFWFPVGAISPNVFLTGTLTGDVPVEAVGDASELLYLYDYGKMTYANVTAAYGGMANTMTARMRVGMIGSNYSAPAQGTIYYLQTLLRVEWAWLALALALVVVTLLFIIAVIIHTSLNGRKPLGEVFSLNLLFTGVAGDVNSQIPDMSPGMSFVRKAWRRLIEAKESVEQKNVDEVQIQMKGRTTGVGGLLSSRPPVLQRRWGAPPRGRWRHHGGAAQLRFPY